jgi:hypothetical protein
MRTSAKDFEKFKRYCAEWAALFGLSDWNIDYAHKNKNIDGNEYYAVCQAGHGKRHAWIFLSTEWRGVDITEQKLKTVALHEIIHVLIAALEDAAFERFVSREEFESAREEVTVRLENVIFKLAADRVK